MAHEPDYHLKLIIGDLTTRLAILSAELEKAQEEIASLKAPKARTKKEAS